VPHYGLRAAEAFGGFPPEMMRDAWAIARRVEASSRVVGVDGCGGGRTTVASEATAREVETAVRTAKIAGAGSASLRSRRGLIERRRAGEDLGVALCDGGGDRGGRVGGRGLRVSGRYDDRRDDDWRDDDAMYYTTNHEINVYQGERV
jgi:hypothetical protein